MDEQLFTWKSCKSDGFGASTYQNVCLVTTIGVFKPGTHFDSAMLNYDTGQISLTCDDVNYVFKLVIFAV